MPSWILVSKIFNCIFVFQFRLRHCWDHDKYEMLSCKGLQRSSLHREHPSGLMLFFKCSQHKKANEVSSVTFTSSSMTFPCGCQICLCICLHIVGWSTLKCTSVSSKEMATIFTNTSTLSNKCKAGQWWYHIKCITISCWCKIPWSGDIQMCQKLFSRNQSWIVYL